MPLLRSGRIPDSLPSKLGFKSLLWPRERESKEKMYFLERTFGLPAAFVRHSHHFSTKNINLYCQLISLGNREMVSRLLADW